MQSLLHMLLSNAAAAGALAGVVILVGLIVRKPAVVRAWWVVVLLKLLCPPVVTFHLWRMPPRSAPPVAIARVAAGLPADSEPEGEVISPPAALAAKPAAQASVGSQARALARRAIQAAPLVWFAGSTALAGLGVLRVWSLTRLLRRARPAPEDVRRCAGGIAERLGLSAAPDVCFVSDVVCPALWGFARRPKVLVPQELWDRLDDAQRHTLLAHELAHLRRRDHWVRLLELAATIVYWWHPAVWVARRQIHDCEEQCCDAWVLWAMPASAHSYGSALLEAVDFVSNHRPLRPALSPGLGEFRHLKRRLLMIRQGSVSRALSRTGLACVCAAGALALPLAPVFGQVSSSSAGAGVPAAPTGPAAAGNVQDESGEAAARSREVAEARARVQRLQDELREATSRLRVLERASGGGAGGGMAGMPGNREALAGAPPAGQPDGARITGSIRAGGGGASISAGGGGLAAVATDGAPRGGGMPNEGGAGGMGPGAGMIGYRTGTTAAAPGGLRSDEDRRLDRLERQLQQLIEQVGQLKRQQGDGGAENSDPGRRRSEDGPRKF